MAKLKDDISFFEVEMPRLKEERRKVAGALKSEGDLVASYAAAHKADMRSLSSVLKVLNGHCDLKIDGDIKALERGIEVTWQAMKPKLARGSKLLQAGASSGGRGGQCKEAASLVLKAGQTLIELGGVIKASYLQYGDKLSQQIDVTAEAYNQRSKDLASAKAAMSKRANDFAVAEGDRKEGKKSLELVEKAKKAIEQKCSVKQSHEERMARRQDEIDALKSAFKVLNGEEIPVGSFLAAPRQA
mmetsp:Transcript_52993/g.123189  ORF Transcript_52993/g.123189 Transcript_52993/m.123189 type:complete len:244 (+) Transcript_52993:1-732(+)